MAVYLVPRTTKNGFKLYEVRYATVCFHANSFDVISCNFNLAIILSFVMTSYADTAFLRGCGTKEFIRMSTIEIAMNCYVTAVHDNIILVVYHLGYRVDDSFVVALVTLCNNWFYFGFGDLQ